MVPARGGAIAAPDHPPLTVVPHPVAAPSEPPPPDVARIVIAVQALRALVYGFGAVILGSALASEGLSDAAVGLVFSVMLAGMALTSVVVGRWGDRAGRRRVYRVLLATMGISGAVFALTSWLPALVLAAVTGTLSTDANESGPITSLEQAMLAEAPADARARLFGRYNAVAYLAGSLGALLAGGTAALHRAIPAVPAGQRWLLAFPVAAVACVAIAARLPSARSDRAPTHPLTGGPLTRSRRNVQRLAGLFAVDAFAGGLVVQGFLVFWFARRYGASTELMGVVFFAAGLLQAGSSLVAGRLAPHLGLLQTMVFTHLPSNILLAAVPLMPSLGSAVAVLLARSALSQMDVPARQAFVAAIVEPSERTAAAAYTNSARYVGRPAGPAVAGVLMQRISLAAPFLVAGAVKVVYDLVIYVMFRHVLAAPDPSRPAQGD
ncbi:MAG TPA: MFS transporter [Candidatus Dormibacteraeota bacterium]